ncbi:hypothetical protein Tco_0091439 [Tanacetum coccineum]
MHTPQRIKFLRKTSFKGTYYSVSFIKWVLQTRTWKDGSSAKRFRMSQHINLVKAFHKNNVFLQYQMDEFFSSLGLRVNANMTSVRSMASLTGGLGGRNSISTNTVAVSSSLRLLEPKRTIESRAKRSSINLVRTQHPSETMVFHNEDGNPARANIKQALGSYERPHKGVKASANTDIMYFFTSARDGDQLQDDVRLCLGDDLNKAQDHNQRQV